MIRARLLSPLLCPFFVALSLPAQQRLSDDQANLVHVLAKQAAFAEGSTGYCAQRDARNASRYTEIWKSWQQRNHWAEIQSGPAAAELQPGEYDNLKTETQRKIAAEGPFRGAMVCGSLQRSLTTPQFDSSTTHGQELAALAAMGNGAPATPRGESTQATTGNSTPVTPPAEAQHIQPPSTQSSPAAPAQETTAAAAGTTATLQDVSFAQPSGWRPAKSSAAGVSFVHPVTRGGNLILVLSEQPMQGDLATSFRSAVVRSFPGTGLTLKNFASGHTADGLPAITLADSGKTAGPRVTFASLRAVGIAAPGNKLLMVELLSTAQVIDFINAQKDLAAVVSSLQFHDAPHTARWDPMHPPASSAGKHGIYWSVGLQNQLNPLGGMDLRQTRDYLMLLPNGQAYSELPKDGHVLDMNFAEAKAKTPLLCGTYTISGNSIHFVFPDEFGLLRDTSGALTAQGLTRDGKQYTELKPVQNLHLSGRYTSTTAMTGNGVSNTTSVVSQHFISFTPDGRYQRSGFSSASGTNFTTMSQRGTDTGTYAINGYTLALTPSSGGQPEIFTIIFETVSESPKAIWVDDNAYLR